MDKVSLLLKVFFAGLGTFIAPILAWMNGVVIQRMKQKDEVLNDITKANEIKNIADSKPTSSKREWLRKRLNGDGE